MRTIETTACGTHGHAEFRLRVDDTLVIEPDIRFLLSTLEEWVAEGEHFKSEETVQLGWGLLKVQSDPDGTLSLWEPDFRSLPIRWRESVTDTLRHLRLHRDVCESYFDRDALDCPSLLASCIACTRLSDSASVVMERIAADAPDSGWFIGCGSSTHDHSAQSELVRVSLYEAVVRNPRALPFMCMPIGVLLEASDEEYPDVFFNGNAVDIKAGSFMEARRRGRPTSRSSCERRPF